MFHLTHPLNSPPPSEKSLPWFGSKSNISRLEKNARHNCSTLDLRLPRFGVYSLFYVSTRLSPIKGKEYSFVPTPALVHFQVGRPRVSDE
jgi:hypothetical protein